MIDMKDVPPDTLSAGATHRAWNGTWVTFGFFAQHIVTGEHVAIYRKVWPEAQDHLVCPKMLWDGEIEVDGVTKPRFEKIHVYWRPPR